MMEKLALIVEDDRDIAEVVAQRLDKDGLKCVVMHDGVSALGWLSKQWPDVLICDLMLPDCPGETLIRYIRASGRSLPTLIMSARDTPGDKVELLTLGADDYLAKPFDLDELAARVAVQLRHAGVAPLVCDELTLGRWSLNKSTRSFYVDGEFIPLTKMEFDLIALMAERPNRVFTRPELFEAVWGQLYGDDANTINVHVSNIRSKLKPTGTDAYLNTVWGVGFRVRPAEKGRAQ